MAGASRAGPPDRVLVVNGDDFGMSDGVNAGVAESFERGILTSASLMVRQRSAPAAAAYAASRPRLAVGLHLDLEDRDYAAGTGTGAWRCERGDPEAIEAECRAQVDRFRELVGAKPTHLDSHHHLHEREPLAGVAERLARELGVPLRGRAIRYEGRFFARDPEGRSDPRAVGTEALVAILRSLPAGATELGCHPGLDGEGSSYGAERGWEVEALCDPAVREAIAAEGIRLASFAELPI